MKWPLRRIHQYDLELILCESSQQRTDTRFDCQIPVFKVLCSRPRFLGPGQHRENLQEEYSQDSTNNATNSDLRRHLLSPYVNRDAHRPVFDFLYFLARSRLLLNANPNCLWRTWFKKVQTQKRSPEVKK